MNNFNPRPPWGGRHLRQDGNTITMTFQSTPSVGRATATGRRGTYVIQFQSTPSVGRATIATGRYCLNKIFQSTPSVGRATAAAIANALLDRFQSTPSVGRATLAKLWAIKALTFQSTPSVGRATSNSQRYKALGNISIHALRGEGDKNVAESIKKYGYFNPRPPWGGRRKCRRLELSHRHFNPRPPWGGRRTFALNNSINAEFQSTPSVGRATIKSSAYCAGIRISIHALRGEGDVIPVGTTARRYISIHALRGEGDGDTISRIASIHNFNPRPPWGGRHFYRWL